MPLVNDAENIEFSHTDFNLLMQRRVYRVLLVCSNYDYFMLEEDGRIDERIFNEYTALSIRFPPVFIQTDSAKKAFEILESDEIDLVILMLNIGEIEPFELAKQVKSKFSNIPIVVLTNFSREVSIRLQREDLSAIDYVFCWLGNADLLLAIIKLIEDKMNAEHDIQQVGVQAILLVEDSIRYISQILPSIYKIIIRQSRDFMNEGLNEHQKMLRLRGRPKILLAKTFDEANRLYHKYGDQMLGIISDISYKKNKHRQTETLEGIELCKLIRSDDHNMPFLLQSSDLNGKQLADELNAGFIYKQSNTLSINLQQYILDNFGFGEFRFRDPETLSIVANAQNLTDLQHVILTIPDNVFLYHANQNEISKWLNARALFAIGRLFKTLKVEDFESIAQARTYIYNAIASYQLSKGRGVIATFNKNGFGEYLSFSRIGEGSLGGKGRGLAFIDSIIKKHKLLHKYKNCIITIPRTVVVSTDLFDEFMEANKLYNVGLSDISDEGILKKFIQSPLPQQLVVDLKKYVESVQKPIAVRSSSKLEDSHFQPFAGVYATYMIPNDTNCFENTLNMLSEAIKCVYASVFFKESKAYIKATSNSIDEEKMGIILEEVCGRAYENRYYPGVSGVARSINFYAVKPEKPEDGIAIIALGLGKHIVEGGVGIRFSPKYPKKVLQLSTPEMVLRETQKTLYALDLNSNGWQPSVNDSINLLKLKIADVRNDSVFRYAASTYDSDNQVIVDGFRDEGKSIVTFSNILNHEVFPLASILSDLLEIGQKEMNNPIEIEFAVDLDTPMNEPKAFYFLQIRPIVESSLKNEVKIDEHLDSNTLVFSKSTLGNGYYEDISDIVYVNPNTFDASKTWEIASEIEEINVRMAQENRSYVLAGPGRWGSSDPWLGIPVKWSQISEARVIIEAGLEKYKVDPSQGTHFFQNLTSFRVGYMTVNQYLNEGVFNSTVLSEIDALFEGQYVRHIRFSKPLDIRIDGKRNIGVINKV
jgi:CheY-like chemotaxis protein